MTNTAEIREAEDQQVLGEVVTNERVVASQKHGDIRFRLPTLDVQRKIDSLARTKKKILRETVDRIPDPEAPDGYRLVPAYKSREVLAKEYAQLGWWTPEQEEHLTDLTNQYTSFLTQLELLGFESEQEIYRRLQEQRESLQRIFGDDEPKEVYDSIFKACLVGGDMSENDRKILTDSAPSTEVDDIINIIDLLRKQYDAYVNLAKVHLELMKLESEKSSLFSDSWQDQLQYYIRLAQVFYCTESAETRKPLFASVEDLEKEQDLEFIRWIFTELQAFWQGLSDDARDRMSKYSFMGRLNTVKSSSEESPVQPESKQDGDSQAVEQTISAEVMDTTTP